MSGNQPIVSKPTLQFISSLGDQNKDFLANIANLCAILYVQSTYEKVISIRRLQTRSLIAASKTIFAAPSH